MKIKSKHRNGDVSIRMSKDAFGDFMRLLRDAADFDLSPELGALEDQIIDEEQFE